MDFFNKSILSNRFFSGRQFPAITANHTIAAIGTGFIPDAMESPISQFNCRRIAEIGNLIVDFTYIFSFLLILIANRIKRQNSFPALPATVGQRHPLTERLASMSVAA